MEFTAKQIAEFVEGRVEGDEQTTVSTFAKIEEGARGALSFLSNPKYLHYIYQTQSSIVLINEDVQLEKPVQPTLIRVKNAYESVARLLQLYESMKPRKTGIDPLAFISPKATVGENVYVGAFAYVADGAVVGEDREEFIAAAKMHDAWPMVLPVSFWCADTNGGEAVCGGSFFMKVRESVIVEA